MEVIHSRVNKALYSQNEYIKDNRLVRLVTEGIYSVISFYRALNIKIPL